MISMACRVLILASTAWLALASQSAIDRGVIPLNYAKDMWHIYKVYEGCSSKDLHVCLKSKFAIALERIARNIPSVQLFNGIAFVRDAAAPANHRRSIDLSDDTFTSIIGRSIEEFLRTHTLKMHLPSMLESRSDDRQPRKKPFGGKKGIGLLGLALASGLASALSGAVNMAMMMGTVVMPVIIGVVAFKAIIVAVLAFVMAGATGMKNMMSHDDKPTVVKIVTPVEAPAYDKKGGTQQWGKAGPDYNAEGSQNLVYSSYSPIMEKRTGRR